MTQPTPFVERLAPAKINWFLEILRKRDDGFHDLTTVMQTIDWCDTLRFYPAPAGAISLTTNVEGLEVDDSNLVVRAAKSLREFVGKPELSARIELDKDIPWGGGLGGGSSDAAATLSALTEFWELSVPLPDLMVLASELGSDVSFFLSAPLAKCEGRGELVAPLEGASTYWLVMLWPGMAVSTPAIYQSGKIDLTGPRHNRYLIDTEYDSEDQRSTPFYLFNRLQAPCFECFDAVRKCFCTLTTLASGRPVLLSGSGSSMFVICQDEADGRAMRAQLESQFPPPARVRLCRTLDRATTTTWRSQ